MKIDQDKDTPQFKPGDLVEIRSLGVFLGRGVVVKITPEKVTVGFPDGHSFEYDRDKIWLNGSFPVGDINEPRTSDRDEHKEEDA